ncbi:hypothetical protein [Palaeococcus ferrophilus]|uniref:hypothetical protein n=1 Tax=Palaeococcus ferrophilus TaxID=83868 RepID=UPI00064E8DF1|nr:hypothetical protein [Palaeococcus ferrophilus]
MRKKALALVFILILAAPAVSALSLKDLLKGSMDAALDLFKREISPIDGYKCVSKAESIILEGAHWYNPDYYIYAENATVEFSWWIPRHVDVKAKAYRVYFGLFALQVEENDDIWWTWWRPYGSKGPGLGAFWVSGFDWKRSGVSEAKKACIAYDLPKSEDILSLDYENMTILENGTVQIVLENGTELFRDFDEVFKIKEIRTGSFEFKHLIGPLYLVRKKDEEGGEE